MKTPPAYLELPQQSWRRKLAGNKGDKGNGDCHWDSVDVPGMGGECQRLKRRRKWAALFRSGVWSTGLAMFGCSFRSKSDPQSR